jgi:hypothetical protein
VRGGTLIGLLVALLALAAAPALGRQDDKPVEIYAPADGATIADGTHGLAVDFICPDYHPEPQDEVVTHAPAGYHLILSTQNAVDANRLLLTTGRVDERDAQVLEDRPGHCTALEDDAGNGPLPREPGKYYLQAYRDCATYVCPGGVEVSDPVAVTVKRTVCTDTRAALAAARKALKQARAALRRKHTAGRRARVTRLGLRVTMLRSRLIVVYRCHP